MKYRRFFPLLIFILVMCRHAERAPLPAPDVLTSVYPVYDLVRNVAGDRVVVDYILPVGANPHHYEAMPADVRRIKAAGHFIGVHPEFDGWVKSLTSAGTGSIFLAQETHGDCRHQEHNHCAGNPHVWMNPAGAKELVMKTAGYLSLHFPESADEIREHSLYYMDRLDSLDQAVRALFTDVDNPAFVQWHPAWDGFANAYGLDVTGTLSRGHGDRPGVKAFQQLVQSCRKNGVRVVVAGLHAEDDLAETLAGEIDGRLIRLDTIGDPDNPERDTYLKLMAWTARVLAKALKE